MSSKRKPLEVLEMVPQGQMEQSVRLAIEHAEWVTDADAATVELALTVARTIDLPTFPIVADGRFDNVSMPLLLRTLTTLGLTPQVRAEWEKDKGEKGEDELAKFRARSHAKRG